MSTFCATLWEEDGKAFQYTVRIEPAVSVEGFKWVCDKCGEPFPIKPMEEKNPWGGTVIWKHDEDKPEDTAMMPLERPGAGDSNENPERPVLHNQSDYPKRAPDVVGAYRLVAQEPRMEEVAPDRPFFDLGEEVAKTRQWQTHMTEQSGEPLAPDRPAPALVEKVAMAISQASDDYNGARAAIAVVLRAANHWEIENQSLRDGEAGVVAVYARENGIDLNAK